MKRFSLMLVLALSNTLIAAAQHAKLPGIAAAMQEMIAKQEIAGAVTAVVTRDDLLHLDTAGFADVASKREMRADTLFWIASMTKPVTGVAVLMLQDEGKLDVADPVSKYLPEFAGLKSPSGKPATTKR
jgi:CubicO group peptidase (beta-lactamase class C family)